MLQICKTFATMIHLLFKKNILVKPWAFNVNVLKLLSVFPCLLQSIQADDEKFALVHTYTHINP